jgi:murein DD-endopeptidase MepM/ murein hydrolase activator NlpD
MSLSTSEKSVRRENPFLRVTPPPIPKRVSTNFAVNQKKTPTPVATIHKHWHKAPGRKKYLWPKIKASLVAFFTGFLVFTLMPTDFQQRAFNEVGLNPSFPQTVLRVPLPVDYDYVSSVYGPRRGRLHQGIDLAAKNGSPIYAASPGRITHSGWESGYGQSVVIDHGNGLKTRYAHCSKLLLKAGLQVQKGQLIARVGSTGHSTGPHLHFEVLLNGVRKNPAWYYPFHQAPLQYTASINLRENWLRHFSEQLAHWVKPST